jgi:predicted enzyme involved in methoxymalonyl-ACP biosynthesis
MRTGGHTREDCSKAPFHTVEFGRHLAGFYSDVLSSYQLLRKTKVLVVVFDNTLWQGVMAEGTLRHYSDLQQLLRPLNEGGMLLVAASKNDVANLRWAEILLQPNDFALMKVNWQTKI